MIDDFTRYEAMKAEGMTSEAVARSAKTDGLDTLTRIRLLRRLFDLSLAEAKELILQTEGGAPSLEEHQSRLIPAIERALNEEE